MNPQTLSNLVSKKPVLGKEYIVGVVALLLFYKLENTLLKRLTSTEMSITDSNYIYLAFTTINIFAYHEKTMCKKRRRGTETKET